MGASVSGIHLAGIHSARPAGDTVPDGSLFSCSTHGLIYKSDYVGNSWSTWATLGTAGGYTPGGTDVAVADGGTGASTAAAALTNLGAGTGDSPQFTGVNLGHASDTTLTRVSAGVVAIEGTNIVKAGVATGSGLTMATARLLGRTTASAGAIEEITVGAGLTLAAGSLTASGGGASAAEDVTFDPTGLGNTSATDVQAAMEDYDAAITAASGGTSIEPWHVPVDVYTPLGQTNWTNLNANGLNINAFDTYSSGAQNDEIYWDLGLSGGTWTVTLWFVKGTSQGIYTVSIDGSSIGTIDGYNGSTTYNNKSSLTGIAIAAGKRRLKLKMATKNASSSQYFGEINGLTLNRTA